jgi:hypothetical protein
MGRHKMASDPLLNAPMDSPSGSEWWFAHGFTASGCGYGMRWWWVVRFSADKGREVDLQPRIYANEHESNFFTMESIAMFWSKSFRHWDDAGGRGYRGAPMTGDSGDHE